MHYYLKEINKYLFLYKIRIENRKIKIKNSPIINIKEIMTYYHS
jgi:hypothetical protein